MNQPHASKQLKTRSTRFFVLLMRRYGLGEKKRTERVLEGLFLQKHGRISSEML
ncbi:hypothetical protein KXJ72_17965 (plasmid) [Comamonas aquatica]|nr:hypothetical protein KXJ72_17965 [Comamonas aquatica]